MTDFERDIVARQIARALLERLKNKELDAINVDVIRATLFERDDLPSTPRERDQLLQLTIRKVIGMA